MSENGHNPVNGSSASGSEMWLRRSDEELAVFANDLRDAFVRPAAPEVAERHITAMVAEAERAAVLGSAHASRAPQAQFKRPARSRWALTARLAAIPAAIVMATAGLALAGVRPPEPVSDVLERAGVDVPGSDADSKQDGGRTEDESTAPAGEAEAQGTEGTAPVNESEPNTGATPGAERANERAAEGQETAEQARNGQTPPDTPGQSGEHPQPQGQGTPPQDPGNSENAGQGKPESPPGADQRAERGSASAHSNAPEEPPKHGHDK